MNQAPCRLIIGQFVVVLALSFLAQRISGPIAALLFIVYAGLTGLTLSGIFFVYSLGSISTAFFVTAGSFAAPEHLRHGDQARSERLGTFLFMGLIGVVIASIVQFWWTSPGFTFVLSCSTVVVFAGLTAYDTQKLGAGGAVRRRGPDLHHHRRRAEALSRLHQPVPGAAPDIRRPPAASSASRLMSRPGPEGGSRPLSFRDRDEGDEWRRPAAQRRSVGCADAREGLAPPLVGRRRHEGVKWSSSPTS